MLTLVCALALGQGGYVDGEKKWRAATDAQLRKEDGWLSVAGLYWLLPGETTVGTDKGCDLVLPSGSAPDRLGSILFEAGTVTLKMKSGVGATIDRKPLAGEDVIMSPDTAESPTRVRVGALTLAVIKRGTRTGIRLYDNGAATRREFRGREWYPVNPTYRIRAEYVAYDKPRQLSITNVLGDTSPSANPGYVRFRLNGKALRLEAEDAGDGLFFNFRDATNGKSTYPAGRFLDTEKPKDGFVVLDFNRAVNPPCAFTHYATCPLAPKENVLAVTVPAGEKAPPHEG